MTRPRGGYGHTDKAPREDAHGKDNTGKAGKEGQARHLGLLGHTGLRGERRVRRLARRPAPVRNRQLAGGNHHLMLFLKQHTMIIQSNQCGWGDTPPAGCAIRLLLLLRGRLLLGGLLLRSLPLGCHPVSPPFFPKVIPSRRRALRDPYQLPSEEGRLGIARENRLPRPPDELLCRLQR